MRIQDVQADHYAIPLPVALSDSTHGTIRDFELVTVRVRDAEGAEGVGLHVHGGRGRRRHPRARWRATWRRCSRGRDAERIEELWQAMWWALHYGGRGGAQALAISAVDIALWDLRARRHGDAALAPARRLRPAGALLRGRHRPRLLAGRAAPADGREPGARLPRHQDEGRAPVAAPRTSSACGPCGSTSAPDFPLMVDANMRWSVDEAIRAARALRRARPGVAGGADDPRRRARPRAHRARGRAADRRRREPAHAPRVPRSSSPPAA